MTLLQSFLLGIVQGLTEFLPVSSTAHLLVAQNLLGIPASDATFSFLVIVQLGTLVSVFVFYRKDLLSIARATLNFRSSTNERNLGLYILFASIPALLAGYYLMDAVQWLFEQPLLEASIRLLAAAFLLALAERLAKMNRTLHTMTWQDALFVGMMQIIAVFPGASRSGTTIVAGLLRGFDRPAAARFAFLLSIPVLLVAGAYQFAQVMGMADTRSFLPALLTGFISAAVMGWFSIKWLIGYLGKHSLNIFASYCGIVGAILLVIQLMGA